MEQKSEARELAVRIVAAILPNGTAEDVDMVASLISQAEDMEVIEIRESQPPTQPCTCIAPCRHDASTGLPAKQQCPQCGSTKQKIKR